MMPDLAPTNPPFPMTAIDLGDGYILMHKRDPWPMVPREPGAGAIFQYLGHQRHNIKIRRWAQVCLLNGQIARTAWREAECPPEKVRPAWHVKVFIHPVIICVSLISSKIAIKGITWVAEVLYFTRLPAEAGIDDNNNQIWVWKDIAMIMIFSLPDNDLLDLFYHTVSSCRHEEDNICVIDIKSILGVVGMVPHKPTLLSGVTEDRYFMVEKLGLDIATFGVPYEGHTAQDDQLDEQEAEAGEDDGGA